eukprot:10243208-Alexandrium_andersonii.AAC.1
MSDISGVASPESVGMPSTQQHLSESVRGVVRGVDAAAAGAAGAAMAALGRTDDGDGGHDGGMMKAATCDTSAVHVTSRT